MQAKGWIDRIDEIDGVTIFLDIGLSGGFATVPLSMFNEEEQKNLKLGCFIVVDIDETLLVTSVEILKIEDITEQELFGLKERKLLFNEMFYD